jgi:DNA-binding response OmpR family regulator
LEELIVRIKGLLDRIDLKTEPVHIKIGNYLCNATKQTFSTETQQLTHRKAQLLLALFKKKNQVLDSGFILNKLWENAVFF